MTKLSNLLAYASVLIVVAMASPVVRKLHASWFIAQLEPLPRRSVGTSNGTPTYLLASTTPIQTP
jgi:hypothetical protein